MWAHSNDSITLDANDLNAIKNSVSVIVATSVKRAHTTIIQSIFHFGFFSLLFVLVFRSFKSRFYFLWFFFVFRFISFVSIKIFNGILSRRKSVCFLCTVCHGDIVETRKFIAFRYFRHFVSDITCSLATCHSYFVKNVTVCLFMLKMVIHNYNQHLSCPNIQNKWKSLQKLWKRVLTLKAHILYCHDRVSNEENTENSNSVHFNQ